MVQRQACPFCEINNEKTRIIRKNILTTVALSNPRLMPGHTLVIPNRHLEKPWELTDNEIIAIFNEINFVRYKLLNSIATGCDVRQNYRPFLAQSKLKVNHVHFHVLPRTDEDGLYKKSMKFEKSIFKDLTSKERETILKLFHS